MMLWTHTHTHTLTARLPHKAFTALFRTHLNNFPSPLAAFSGPGPAIPTNHRSVYSDQSEGNLFGPITDYTPTPPGAASGLVLSWVLKRAVNALCGRRVVSVCPHNVYFTSSPLGPSTFLTTLFLNTFSPRVCVLFYTSESVYV